MGAVLSLSYYWYGKRWSWWACSEDDCHGCWSPSTTLGREDTGLIPGLPNELSIQILARVPRIQYLRLKSVSRAWRDAVSGPEVYRSRRELGTSEEWLYVLTKVGRDKLLWYGLDPLSRKWQRLPLMPVVSFEDEARKGLGLGGGLQLLNVVRSALWVAELLRGSPNSDDVSKQTGFYGCAVTGVNGSLYVLGGFSNVSTLRCVWRYDLAANRWSKVARMWTGRAYCKTGILNNKLYVVGGVTRGSSGLVPLRSAEVYETRTNEWSEIPSVPFRKAHALPTGFIADLLRPITTGMTSYRGRLFVPQSLCSWPIFLDAGGEVYDADLNSWNEMPAGMGDGWPARKAGTKLGVTVKGDLYSLDLSSSLDSAQIKVYDHQDDAWKVVEGQVPIHDFAESEVPYLLASMLGILHVITKDAESNIRVIQADVQKTESRLPSTAPSYSAGYSSRTETGNDPLRILATKNTGPAELVACQTLDL